MKKILCITFFCTSFLAYAAERGWYERLGVLENNPSNKKNTTKRRSLGNTGAETDKNVAAIKKNPAAMKEPEPLKYGDNLRKSGSFK
jgi:hypothetical protein